MARLSTVGLAALVLLAAAAGAAAQRDAPDTTGQQITHAPGYTFGSNVAGYLRLSTDVCDIKAAIGTSENPDYSEAKKIYTDGKNSYKSDGKIRTLRELATKSYAGEPIFDLYADYFGSAAFMDQPVSFAFAGDEPYKTTAQRNETIVKGIESNLQTVYLLHELDEAADKIRAKKLSPIDGAPHNVDETWAIYVGLTPACSLWGASQKRSMEFGTMESCTSSQVNAGMLNAHRRLYAAASAGNLAAFQDAQAEVVRLFLITYIQATLKYAELMDKARAKNDLNTLQADQAEGAAFFRTIEPLVARANNRSAATVKQVMSVGAPVPPSGALAVVKPALEATYADLNISPAEIGSYGAKQPLNCAPTSSAASSAATGGLGALAATLLAVLALAFGLH